MINLKTILAISTMILFFASCSKDGETGPQGPAGTDGNANVSSQTITVSQSDWSSYNNTLGGLDWVAQKNVPSITSAIVNNGAVMVYLRQTYSGGEYYYEALPFGWVVNSNSMRTFGFSISAGTLNVRVEDTDNSLSGLGTYIFKVVIMDGSQKAANPNLDLNNYEAVQRALSLKD